MEEFCVAFFPLEESFNFMMFLRGVFVRACI